MKKLFITALGLACAVPAMAASKAIPADYQGCWNGQKGAHHTITKNTIETPTDVDYIVEEVVSVRASKNGGILVKTDYDSTYNLKLSKDKKTLFADDFGKKYKKAKCGN